MKIIDKIKGLSKGAKIAIISLLVILIAARIAAPYIIIKYVNKTLCDIDGYCGKIEDVDLCLIRGAYVIEGLELNQVENDIETPFVEVKEIDISVQWKALLQGAIVAEIEFLEPNINFVKEKGEAEVQAGQGADWREVVKDLVPLSINRLAIINGKVSYKEPEADPAVDMYLDKIDVTVTNLNNSANEKGKLVSDFNLKAFALNHATLSGTGAIDPFNKNGSFDLNFQLSDLRIKEFNDYLKKAINVDVEEGTFNLYTEIKANNGQVSGYAKPLIKNLKFLKLPEEKDNNFFNKIWEGVLDITANIFQNNKKDEQIASNIVIKGSLQKPGVEIFTTIRYLLRNAFIEGLKPNLYNIVNFDEDNNLRKEIANEVTKKEPRQKEEKTKKKNTNK